MALPQVVTAAVEQGGEEELVALMARFRKSFVDALQPRHLSPAWQIDHRCVRGSQAWRDFDARLGHVWQLQGLQSILRQGIPRVMLCVQGLACSHARPGDGRLCVHVYTCA